MKICQVTSNEEKQRITRQVLEALPEWFGIPEARENYISESRDQLFFCAYAADKPVGFLYLKEIVKGESYIMLSAEEIDALRQAITMNSIDLM